MPGIFTGMAIWVGYGHSSNERWETPSPSPKIIWAVIKNKTNGTEWTRHELPIIVEVHSWVHIIPKTEFAVESGDKIEVSITEYRCLTVERCAIHLIYKPEITDIHVAETTSSSKRMKVS